MFRTNPLALLIGFQYHDLNGTVIDLYHAHKWCQTFNCDIHVITDIGGNNGNNENRNNLEFAIRQGVADVDLRTFYDRLTSKYVVANKDQFVSELHAILDKARSHHKMVIYYTGHGLQNGLENGIKLPDSTLMSFNEFRNHILSNIYIQVEIFWILDCCNPNGLSLPYQLRNNQFMFKDVSNNISSNIYYGMHRILLITSANPDEKSVATKTGSLFTRYLFKILTNMTVTTFDVQKPLPLIHNRNLQRLIGNIASAIRTVHSGYQQTVSIYTSYIQDPVLWMWIGSNKPYDISTHIDDHSVIMIRRHI